MGNVLVIAEHLGGKLRSVSQNAITYGKKLAEASGGGDLIALLIGSGLAGAAAELAELGATKVLTVEDAALAAYMAETYAPVVAKVAKDIGAVHVCSTATPTGKDLMPRVAGLLEAGMASDVSDVTGPRTFQRPMVAGNAIAVVEVLTETVVSTCRQTEWDAAQPTGSKAPIEAVAAGDFDALGAEVVSVEIVKSERPDLAEAKVVISGGRGMKNAENFKMVEELADTLGGAVGATRSACDAGMIANDLQVGQTGKVVAPDLYIAIALSGAIQHLAGMKSSKVIVAINKDPEAPIFEVSDYGLVAKWEDTLADLTSQIKAIKES